MRISDWSSDVCFFRSIVRLQAAEQDLSDRVDRRNPTGPTRPAGRAGLRIAGLLEASPAFRFWTPRRLNGGCECPWVRNKGGRSEERRVGKEGVSTCRTGGARDQ